MTQDIGTPLGRILLAAEMLRKSGWSVLPNGNFWTAPAALADKLRASGQPQKYQIFHALAVQLVADLQEAFVTNKVNISQDGGAA